MGKYVWITRGVGEKRKEKVIRRKTRNQIVPPVAVFSSEETKKSRYA